ncbi:MAG: hypothetical protein WC005_07865 [Candidatus Nanopelagicales bacterium]
MTTSRRRVLIPAAVLALGLIVSGCSNSTGDAAVVGDQHITEQTLNSDVTAVLTAQGYSENKADSSLVTQTLNWLIVMDLLGQVGNDHGVVVTQGEIDRERASEVKSAGGADALEAAYLKQFVASAQINDRIKFALLAQKVATAIAPGESNNKATAALISAVIDKSKAVNPEVNPRYGTWSSENLQLAGVPTDLSTPLPTPAPSN